MTRREKQQDLAAMRQWADEQYNVNVEAAEESIHPGLQKAHEQVGDVYREGTIDQLLE